jgi:2-acylglycerol O-acyltransferase 2
MWNFIQWYFPASITLENELDHKKQYIFCCFPHGPISANHLLTMTNGCEMQTKHYKGARRDLCASVLFTIPIFKDILIWLGCVDASPITAHYNMKKGNSIFIYVGGEKEQLMSESGLHRIYLLERKGFVKLALQYGADLIPMYAFGENEVYTTSNILLDFRKWLQKSFSLGIPICFGRWGSFLPHRKRLALEIGKPIEVKAVPKEKITQKEIDELHELFVKEMRRLFDRTKVKYPEHASKQLEIL